MPDFTPLLGDASPLTNVQPVEAAFRAVLNRFRETGFFSRYDEETITGAFLGGLNTVFPFCAALFSSEEHVQRCCWGHFRKSVQGPGPSEAQAGADFALVVYQNKKIARVALFQAKKVDVDDGPKSLAQQTGSDAELLKTHRHVTPEHLPSIANLKPLEKVPKGRWLMDVHRRPSQPAEGPWREAQLLKLAEFGKMAAQLVTERANKIIMYTDELKTSRPLTEERLEILERFQSCVALARRNPSFDEINWVHYLAYASGEVGIDESADISELTDFSKMQTIQETVCVPLCALDKARWREIAKSKNAFSHNWVDLSEVNCYRFMDILREGVRRESPLGRPAAGWLTVDNAVLSKLLPDLMDLTTVYIADDKDGRSGLPLELQRAIKQLTLEPVSGLGADAAPTRTSGMGGP